MWRSDRRHVIHHLGQRARNAGAGADRPLPGPWRHPDAARGARACACAWMADGSKSTAPWTVWTRCCGAICCRAFGPCSMTTRHGAALPRPDCQLAASAASAAGAGPPIGPARLRERLAWLSPADAARLARLVAARPGRCHRPAGRMTRGWTLGRMPCARSPIRPCAPSATFIWNGGY